MPKWGRPFGVHLVLYTFELTKIHDIRGLHNFIYHLSDLYIFIAIFWSKQLMLPSKLLLFFAGGGRGGEGAALYFSPQQDRSFQSSWSRSADVTGGQGHLVYWWWRWPVGHMPPEKYRRLWDRHQMTDFTCTQTAAGILDPTPFEQTLHFVTAHLTIFHQF